MNQATIKSCDSCPIPAIYFLKFKPIDPFIKKLISQDRDIRHQYLFCSEHFQQFCHFIIDHWAAAEAMVRGKVSRPRGES